VNLYCSGILKNRSNNCGQTAKLQSHSYIYTSKTRHWQALRSPLSNAHTAFDENRDSLATITTMLRICGVLSVKTDRLVRGLDGGVHRK
jgi:hypothetical protein